MRIQSLGHVVLKVRNQERAEAFYHGILNFPIAARGSKTAMTFFSLGNHHDFAIEAIGDEAPGAGSDATGLAHVAFKIGHSLDELRAAKSYLQGAGVAVVEALDHNVTQSLYVHDPDGNTIELYVDASDVWKQEPAAVASAKPLDL